MLKLSIFALVVLAASSAAAEPSPYMRRDKSNELPLLVEARGCPVDSAAVRQMAEGVFTQFQITPLDPTKIEFPLAHPWLNVNVACLGGGVAFRTDVDFIGRLDLELVRLSLNGYGGFGMADKDAAFILEEIKQRVETAVADYVAANAAPDVSNGMDSSSPTNRHRVPDW